MAVSKVILNGDTLMDVTQDTVTSSTLSSGITATDAAGESITGTHEDPVARGTGTNSLIAVNTAGPNTAAGENATALGAENSSSGKGSVTLGTNNIASAQNAIAIGSKLQDKPANQATQVGAVAIGTSNQATNYYAVAAGNQNVASGHSSIALGGFTEASGSAAFTAGMYSTAGARASAAIGNGTEATGQSSFVAGAFNVPDSSAIDTSHGIEARKYIMIVGNGTDANNKSNALTLDWDGNLDIAGALFGLSVVNGALNITYEEA